MVIALLLLTLIAGLPQDPPKEKENKPPKRGDTVIAKGCIRGGALETSDVSRPDGSVSALEDLVTFRLTGDRKQLEELKKEHDGHVDAITGELRTDLPTKGIGGRKIGNSRITVGVGGSRGMMPEPPPPMPVLKVASFEHTGVTCR